MEKKKLVEAIDQWLIHIRDEYVADVIGAVNIPSISVFEEGPHPFGNACADMLDYMQAITQKYGFAFENHEYYCATSLITGKDRRAEIGMLGHLDVVTSGEGWSGDPFHGYEKNGYIIGRGSNDNKGSTFDCLYAMRFLKEYNFRLKNDVRLFFGCNEEAGMKDVQYYGEHHVFPDVSLVVDSWWPVSCSEKGVYKFILAAEIKNGNLKKFETVNSAFAVPNKCLCVLEGIPWEKIRNAAGNRADLEVIKEGEGVKIIAHGIGKHVSFPEDSINAVGVLAAFLLENHFLTGDAEQVLRFVEESIRDYEGKALGADFRDDFAGYTTHVLHMAELKGEELHFSYYIGYPASPKVDKEEVYRILKNYFSRPFLRIVKEGSWEPHFVDINHPIVDILCRNSSAVLKKPMKPFAQAGGTYTWVTPNAIAAGPAVHGREQKLFLKPGHGGAHQPDECMEIDMLLDGIKIYILSLMDIDEWMWMSRE